jgi:hypothetical protein
LQPRALIGYLVGFDSTNIFKIWNPATNQIHRVRDVVFTKERYDPGALENLPELVVAEREVVEVDLKIRDGENWQSDNELFEFSEPATMAALNPIRQFDTVFPSNLQENPQGTPHEIDQLLSLTTKQPPFDTVTDLYGSLPTPSASRDTSEQPLQALEEPPVEPQAEDPDTTPNPATSLQHTEDDLQSQLLAEQAEQAERSHDEIIRTGRAGASADLNPDFIIQGSRTRSRRQAHAAILDTIAQSFAGYYYGFATGLTKSHLRAPPPNSLHRDYLPAEPRNYKEATRHPF